jgi:DNA invertase Pin-like site-specific DNA recombinase
MFCKDNRRKKVKMKIGYARVSTEDQKLELQLADLKKAGCRKIYQEKVSGTRRDRPELEKMIDQLREGDVVVVSRLDRIARSTRHLLEIMETIRDSGTKFQSLAEPWADTTSHSGKLIMTIFGGIAEFERDLIRDRTSAGRSAAKKRGVVFGRPKKLSDAQKKLAQRLLREGKSVRQIAETFEVHESTIYRIAQ